MGMTDWTERTSCVICGEAHLTTELQFQKFPAFLGCVETPASEDICSSMTFLLCEDCGSLQLRELAPLSLLYGAPHADAPGAVWEKHWLELAEFVGEHSGERILEIGGGNGKLAVNCMANDRIHSWTILEPNPQETNFADPRINFELGWLDEKYQVDNEVDTILFSHVFEHLHDPAEVLATIARAQTKQIIVSFPDMKAGLERSDSNVLHFEHTYFADSNLLSKLFRRFGYELSAQKFYGPGHSVFFSFVRGTATGGSVSLQVDERREIFRRYFAGFRNEAETLTEKLRAHTGPRFISPASIFSQMLFGSGLDEKLFDGILDNSPLKIGRRLYGTALTASSPLILKGVDSPLIMLRAGVYSDEIRGQILRDINPTAKFI